jgi:polyhydroxybutyrate depolymerase
MKKLFKVIALLLVVLLAGLALAAAWLLRWDEIAPPELPGVVEGAALQHGEQDRRWLAYIPASRMASPPILLVLHGSLGDGPGMRASTFYSFDVQAERAGYIAVYPDGVENHWNDCRRNASYAANRLQVDDVGFLRALVAELVNRYGADPERVFATGLSNGGQMVYRLALEAPELIAGGAAIVANLPVADNSDCVGRGVAVPMLVMNGTEDPVNPDAGGVVQVWGDSSRGEVMSSLDTARYWARLAGHDLDAVQRTGSDRNPDDATSVARYVWRSAGHSPVELVSLEGGGHTFPHPVYSLPRILGPTSHELDGAEVIWAFFSSLPINARR